MAPIGIALRRTLALVALAVAVGALLSWRRREISAPTATATPQWPDWPAQPDAAAQPTALSPQNANQLPWLPANNDGSAPDSHPVKAKESSGIFHVPGGRFYERTKPDRCYPTAAAAEADGYRQSKT
ncbi:MAG TPA: hypothetical protein VMY16_00545 [Ilumatobacteraceae bacterium]|nr:hypothetical protein [Ilumatobacteraceae bacterium]